MSEEKKDAIAVRAMPQRSFSLLPNSLGEANEMATLIANSEFAPKGYQGKPANVLIAVQMGADIGLKPMQALQSIAVINGRPSIWGDAALALAMPALDRFKETLEGSGDDAVATCLLKRKGWPDETVRTFSMKDAMAAGLKGKDGPWQKYPQRMLQMRARSWALRDSCADLLMGLVLAEEAMDFPDAINATAVSVEDVEKPKDLLEALPEALRDNLEKAFSALNMVGGQRLQKINEFLGKPEVVPEEAAGSLLEWCRDEFSKRKTGAPRKKADNGVKKQVESKPPVESKPEPPPVQEAEIVETHPATPSASDIPWGNQGQKAPDSELF